MIKKALLIAPILTFNLIATGQSRWCAPIDTVARSGYYNIRLSAQWAGLSKQDCFEDLRILDENGEEVPYLVRETPSVDEASRLEYQTIYSRYDPIAPGRISVRVDSLRRTRITFPGLARRYGIDLIQVHAAPGTLFRRDARLETGPRTLALVLSSKSENAFFADRFPVDSMSVLTIFNGGNPPLGIDSVRLWSLPRYLCARLEAGRRYTLTAGAERRSCYDLEYFRDELTGGSPLPVVHAAPPVREEFPRPPSPRVRFFERPGFLWAVMALAGVILIGVCLQALRTVRKRDLPE